MQQPPGRRGTGSNSTQIRQVAFAIQVSRRTDEKDVEAGMETLN